MLIKDIYHNSLKIRENIKLDLIFKKQKNNIIKLNKDRPYTLFITNNHTGGTRDYEKSFENNHHNLFVLRREGYYTEKDKYFSIEFNKNKYFINKYLLQNIIEYNFEAIIISTLIDFDNIDIWFKSILSYKNKYSTKIVYLVHDFHSICPNCNLFTEGKYCNLQCSKYHCSNFHKFSGDIESWRTLWNSFFKNIDEIRCFSESSKDLIKSVYPEVERKITVVPHDISYIKYPPIKNLDNLEFHIGIVGTVFGEFKGRDTVKSVIERYGNTTPVTLIGAQWWRFPNLKRKVKCLGPYKRDDLPNIITSEKISCVLFPSLWPETFSYLVSELIAMGVPVICFNIGAQAEKCSNYEKGIVVKNQNELWEALDEMRNAGTWSQYIRKNPNFRTKYVLK